MNPPLASPVDAPATGPERQALERSARRLSYFTVGYNLLEGGVSIAAGAAAGSVALLGFGLDSFVESLSGSVMIWRFRRADPRGEWREAPALRLVGATFVILGSYVAIEAVLRLLRAEHPTLSVPGFVVTILSLIVMPLLYVRKRRTAEALGSRSLGSDARQTLACVKLSAAVLVGLVANAAFGGWWVDPLIALGISLSLLHEGWESMRGETD